MDAQANHSGGERRQFDPEAGQREIEEKKLGQQRRAANKFDKSARYQQKRFEARTPGQGQQQPEDRGEQETEEGGVDGDPQSNEQLR